MPSEIEFDHQVSGNLPDATTREWLETNGIGGFASSTIIGLNTRRYHGLLIATTKPPVGRVVALEARRNAVPGWRAFRSKLQSIRRCDSSAWLGIFGIVPFEAIPGVRVSSGRNPDRKALAIPEGQ